MGAQLLTLGVLPQQDARQLLTARLGEDRVRAEPAAAAELVRLCAGLPHALAELRAQRRLGLPATGGDTSGVGEVFSWSHRRISALAAAGPGFVTHQ
jgi:hypothetical protein